jgi:oxygen-dependent protoporphyrinogen oxidase
MKTVAIIGGGITGLTAAFRLAERGVKIVLYESSDRVGGVIHSVRRDGFLAEFGPNTILETSPKITALIKDLGLQDRRMNSAAAASNRYLVRGRKPVALPASPVRVALTPLFSFRAKLMILREPFIRRAPAEEDEPLAKFVVRRLGKEFLDYAINPMVAGVYAGDPARLSVREAFPKLWKVEQRYGSLILGQFLGARERKRSGTVSKANAPKLSFDQGLQVLVETLQNRLAPFLRLSTTVNRIVKQSNQWKVTSTSDGTTSTDEFDAVLIAIPAYKIAELEVEAPGRLDLSPLGKIYYPPVASIVLGYRRQDIAHPLDGFGMLIPQVEAFNSLGVLFSSSLFPNRAPAGHVTLTCYIGGARSPERVSLPEDELYRQAHEDITTLLGASAPPVFRHHTIYRKAIPQYEVGYGRFKELLTQVETRAPGLFFAGHYRDGISMGDSIVSGNDICERMLAP